MIHVITTIMMLVLTTTTALPEAPQTEIQILQAHIDSLPYTPTQIQDHVFDCSDASAMTQNELSKMGWDARILILWHPDNYNHAMVRVYATEIHHIECTRKVIVPHIPKGYAGVDEFKNVVAVIKQTDYTLEEWGIDVYIEQLEANRMCGPH